LISCFISPLTVVDSRDDGDSAARGFAKIP
jgi:hypothetical protein